MNVSFVLGDVTFTRRYFCHSMLEMVLQGLPAGTFFNVVQYGGSVVKIFEHPVLVSQTSVDAALDKVTSTWRDDYSAVTDPLEWLRKLRGFSLDFKHKIIGTSRKTIEALQLAYAIANLSSQQREESAARKASLDEPEWIQLTPSEYPVLHQGLEVSKDSPQIYLLTSGRPDGGAGQILGKVEQFDDGRNISVNCITFSNASADPVTKQFGKDLAGKTGGFFRSIEQS